MVVCVCVAGRGGVGRVLIYPTGVTFLYKGFFCSCIFYKKIMEIVEIVPSGENEASSLLNFH